MRRRDVLTFIFALSALFAVAQPQNHDKEVHWESKWSKVRIISYNVLSAVGGETEPQLVEWLNQQDPEIVAFQELCGITEDKLLEAAKQWGHNYAAIVKENGYPVGITSKEPITVVSRNIDGFGHGMLHVKTYGLNCLVTHLNPGNWEKRLEEANNIANYINDNKLDSVVLMGDMNSHSPMDAEYLENNAILLPIMRGGKESKNFPNGNFDYFAISRLLSTPLFDVVQPFVKVEERMTFPSDILMTTSKSKYYKKKRSERLDFIFVSQSIVNNVVDGFVFNGEPTGYISDHYPVAIDILLY